MQIKDLLEPLSFEWDAGNQDKNQKKHGIFVRECEEIFSSSNAYIQPDELHSGREERYIIIGYAKENQPLFIVFTIRNKSVHIISARRMHKKEILFYEKKVNITKIQK